MRLLSGITLVVVNYRTPEDLDRFCASISAGGPVEVVIVNVSPTEADMEVARRWADRLGGRTWEFVENVGYGRAVNRGAAGGRRETLAIFNADVVLCPGALDACHQALVDHPDWGVLGPCQVDDRGRFTHAGIFGTPDAPKHRGWRQADRGQYRDVAEAVTVSGSAYFVRRATWDQLTACEIFQNHDPAEGAFLPTPFYFEETYCSYHARAHDWKVVYFGEATIIHTWHASVRANEAEGWAAERYVESQATFRAACDAHLLTHD